MMLRPDDLTSAVARAKIAMAELEQLLNAADARLGDGDTGGMLARLIDALAETPVQADIGLQFTAFGKANWPEVAASAIQTVDETLDQFRARPIRTGRARMFGERTIGIDDPGMLAFALLTRALAKGG